MAEYKLDASVDAEKVFLVKRSEIDDRLDTQYYINKKLFLTKFHFPLGKIKEYFLVKDGDHDKLPENEKVDEINGKRYIRAQDIKDGLILNNNPIFISEYYFNKIKRCHIYPGDLLISIMASLGLNAIVPNDYEVSTANRAVGILRNITNNTLLTKYLQVLLNTEIGFWLFELQKKGGIQQRLNLSDIGDVEIPIPPKNIQQQIVDLYQSAYEQKQQKEAEAERLLNSIDNYLLGELGITLPEKDNSLEARIFTTQFSEVVGGRIDSFWLKNKHFTIEGGKYKNEKLQNIAYLKKGQSITSDKVINGAFPVIAGGQTSPYTHNEFNFEGNVITISASGAYSGFVWFHNYPIFASDCTVIFSKNEDVITTLFLSEILKVKQSEIYNLQQGAGQPHVYASDLSKLNIPLPRLEKQNEIVNYIQNIREQAKTLQQEATEVLETAKQKVEQMILGE